MSVFIMNDTKDKLYNCDDISTFKAEPVDESSGFYNVTAYFRNGSRHILATYSERDLAMNMIGSIGCHVNDPAGQFFVVLDEDALREVMSDSSLFDKDENGPLDNIRFFKSD